MKNLRFFALEWSAFAFTIARAASNSTYPPDCGLKCIGVMVLESTCSPTNISCICTNQQLTDSISLCVSSNCTIRDQLSTEKYSKETCGAPVVDRGKLATITCLVGSAAAFLAFFLRIIARLLGGAGNLGLDDLCLTGTMLLNVPFTAFSVILVNAGLGKDMWEVPFDNITYILYIYWWDELIYIVALPLIKISILFFYLRIFPDNRFRQITWILIVANIAYTIAFFLITLFQCQPIEGAWKRAAINIVLDGVMLCLPLPSLYKLNLSLKKKFQILLMFGVGFFVTLVSIIRLQSLVEWGYSTNITQDNVSVGYWSTIEVHVGIICACMPALKGLLQRTLPSKSEPAVVNSMPYHTRSSNKARTPSAFSRSAQETSKQDGGSSVHELMEVGEAS